MYMSDREKVYQLLDVVPDYKIGYVVAYLQGMTEGEDVKPNKETLEAFAEVDEMKRTGSGQRCLSKIKIMIEKGTIKDVGNAISHQIGY